MADFDVSFSSQFDSLVVAAVLPNLRNLRDDIEDDMLRDVPVGETGNLKRSVYCDLNETTGEIVGGAGGPDADYADDVELGHEARDGSQVSGQPFVRPAFLRKRGSY